MYKINFNGTNVAVGGDKVTVKEMYAFKRLSIASVIQRQRTFTLNKGLINDAYRDVYGNSYSLRETSTTFECLVNGTVKASFTKSTSNVNLNYYLCIVKHNTLPQLQIGWMCFYSNTRPIYVENGFLTLVKNYPDLFILYSADGTNAIAYTGVEDKLNLYGWLTGSYSMLPNANTQAQLDKWVKDVPEDTDPFAPGGNSKPGGGGGAFTEASDPIDFPPLPIISAEDSGFVTLYNPTIQQLFALNNAMWSDIFDINTWKRLFTDPMDCLLGLSIVPVAVPHGESRELHVGNISTGVSITKATAQFVELDCGSLPIEEYWGCYLDYAPFTKIEIYLPYVGAHQLDTDECMAKNIHVKYHVDIMSGSCVAYIKCGDAVLYQFSGNCNIQLPLNGANYSSILSNAIQIATAIGVVAATGGTAAPAAGTSAALARTTSLIHQGANSANAVATMKPTIQKAGNLSGTNGLLSIQNPYITITRPNQALPKNQNTYMGYPSHITAELGKLKGYTVVEEIHLQGVMATDAELEEIESLLKSGVVI